MAEFLIERILPGVAELSVADLREVSRLSFKMLTESFPDIHWLHSYATDDILYCVYRAADEAIIRDYARGSALPVHKISRIHATIDIMSIEDSDQARAAARQRMLEHARFCRHLAKTQTSHTKEAILNTALLCERAAEDPEFSPKHA